MTQWYVKDLSKLTGVSVQTLHHYDRIELLKPSVRLANGYRLYCEKDLLKLQQIIALKFFGFELSQIKTLLTGNVEMLEHFAAQARCLEERAKALLEASQTLKSISAECRQDKSIPWESIIKIIEVYRMTQNIEHSWVKEIFTPEELKQYAAFEKELQAKATSEQKAAFDHNWDQLVEEVKHNLQQDPTSKTSIALAKKWMDWVNGLYGKKYAHLRTKIFEQGFGEGKGLDEVGLTPEIVSWVEKAMDAYWRDRLYGVLNKVGTGVSDEIIFKLWNEVLDDMYGDDNARKKELYDVALSDDKVSEKAKEWLRILRELIVKNSHLL